MKKFFKDIRPLIALIKMQFKNKTSLNFKSDKKGLFIRVLIYLCLLVGLTVGLYFFQKLFADNSIFGLFVVPIYFFNFLFICVFLFTLISCLNRFTDDLYLSPDNQFLVTLPVNIDRVFLSKLIVYYLTELFRSAIVFIPLLFSYGILNNYHVGYYFWVLFILIFVLMVPVCFASVISVLVFKLKMWLKANPIKENIILAILLIAIFIALITIFSLMPTEMRLEERWQTVVLPRLKNFTLVCSKVFYPITMMLMLMLGFTSITQSPYRLPIFTFNTWWLLLVLLVFIALCILFDFALTKRWFFSSVAKSYEHKKYTGSANYIYSSRKLEATSIYISHKDSSDVEEKELINIIDELYSKEMFLEKNGISMLYFLTYLKQTFKKYNFFSSSRIRHPSITLCKEGIYRHPVACLKDNKKKTVCYDPYHFAKKSKRRSPFASILIKDFIRDFRSASALFSNLSIILVPSLLAFILNTIFSSLRLSILGNQLVFTFTIVIELLSLFIYSSAASSIYSKDQKNSYILNVSPVKYYVSISTKLIHQLVIGTISIIILMINYAITSPLTYINYVSFTLMFIFLFIFHLISSAEIDLKHLENYNFSAKTSEKAGEQNELFASLLSILVAVGIALIGFLLLREENNVVCTKLMFIALTLLVLKLILFFAKLLVKGKKIKKEDKTL